jgi:hypothetical protein
MNKIIIFIFTISFAFFSEKSRGMLLHLVPGAALPRKSVPMRTVKNSPLPDVLKFGIFPGTNRRSTNLKQKIPQTPEETFSASNVLQSPEIFPPPPSILFDLPDDSPGALADTIYDNRHVKRFEIDGRNLYFPIDCRQPTAAQVAEWSCANVESAVVTDWFLMIYGLKDYEGKYLQNGFDKRGIPKRIVDFDENMNDELDSNLQKDSGCQTRKDLFLQEFTTMASSSVGRVLLYRQLLEIRRKTVDDG